MNITKDEARILQHAINEYKYIIVDESFKHENLMKNLDKLESKLNKLCRDKRRTGRTSMDDWSDLLKRFSNKY
jgi:hypothetical protein